VSGTLLPAHPAFEDFAALSAAAGGEAMPGPDALNALTDARHVNAAGQRIRFVAAAEIADGESFEARIGRSGRVAMRAGDWHDYCNALAWLRFPRTKRRLNRLHCAPAPGAGTGRRGALRDALTHFDEDGMLVACSDATLAGLLREFRWKDLFWHRRDAMREGMRFHVFGHALADKLRAPFRGLTAKALVFAVDAAELRWPPAQQLAEMDARAAAWFREPALPAAARAFAPLPVLGIPGWHADNGRADFYDDTWQFRPGRGLRRVDLAS
jgi:hypothetical protein